MTMVVSARNATPRFAWGAAAQRIPLGQQAPARPCSHYLSNCAGYSCIASSPSASPVDSEVLVAWETGVAQGCSSAACAIVLSRVQIPGKETTHLRGD